MKGGFSFCGTDIASLGLEYAPELKDTNVYRPSKANIHEETFDGHDGSYIYGTNREAKEFILRCFFEEKVIDRGIMAQVYNVFKPGRSGKLIFQRRPWCYYYATVTDVDDTELSNYMNGIITISMRASYPFSRCEKLYNERTEEFHDAIMLNTALFDKAEMVPPYSFGSSEHPITSATKFILANPGTEPAKVGIVAAGYAGRGVLITNETTGQECKLVAMSHAKTTDVNKHVYVDGLNGKTMLVSENGSYELAFLFHDHGYIELEPAYPSIRDIYINYEGTTINVANNLIGDYTGQYIYANNTWHKILSNDNHAITIEESLPQGEEKTTIFQMNTISVRPIGEMSLSRLSFIYKPTFA